MITYQREGQEDKKTGKMSFKHLISCLKSEIDTLPSFLLTNGSKAITTDEGKKYIYDEDNEGWNEL